MTTPENISKQLSGLRMLILDVDGVLTDGRLHYGPHGEELKVFHVHDGLGLKQLMQAGITIAVISGRDCEALRTRLTDLGIKHHYLGQSEKIPAMHELFSKTNITAEHCAYMGDDLPDLEPMQKVALSFAPANAHTSVLQQAHWVCEKSGGQGAVREVCDLILAKRSGSN